MNTELECKVLNLLNYLYQREYNHRLEVIHNEADDINPSEYILHLYVHDNRWYPLTIAKQCDTEKEFLEFLEQELKKRNLIRSDYYKIEKHESN